MEELTIRNGALWDGERERAPLGTKVVQVLKVASDSWVVCEDHYGFPPGRSNIYCVDRAMRVIWSVELPAPEDVFCNAGFVDGKLFVSTWSCYRCEVDPHSGRILASKFTK